MRHLIIFAHPSESSINNFFKESLVRYLTAKGNDVRVRDLYKMNFNPILSKEDLAGQRQGKVDVDVLREQEFLLWSERITFIYPIWWTGLPAILKGYIDRVFSYGFAYTYINGVQEGLLTGKSAYIINTQGKSKFEYLESGMGKALIMTSDFGIFSYCGLNVKRHFFFDRADKADIKVIEAWMNEIKKSYEE